MVNTRFFWTVITTITAANLALFTVSCFTCRDSRTQTRSCLDQLERAISEGEESLKLAGEFRRQRDYYVRIARDMWKMAAWEVSEDAFNMAMDACVQKELEFKAVPLIVLSSQETLGEPVAFKGHAPRMIQVGVDDDGTPTITIGEKVTDTAVSKNDE